MSVTDSSTSAACVAMPSVEGPWSDISRRIGDRPKRVNDQRWDELYPELASDLTQYFAEATFEKGDVTFLSPEFYQGHKLINKSPPGQMMATIQCYRYPDSDNIHYEYFDYIDEHAIEHFTPNSDWEFLDFKRLLRE